MPRPLTPLGLAVPHLLHAEQILRDQSIDEVVKVAHGSLHHTVARLPQDGPGLGMALTFISTLPRPRRPSSWSAGAASRRRPNRSRWAPRPAG